MMRHTSVGIVTLHAGRKGREVLSSPKRPYRPWGSPSYLFDDRPHYDHSAACVIAQQYSSAIFIIALSFRQTERTAAFKNGISNCVT